MVKKKFKLFFITEKLDELNLDYVKKIGAILILRNIYNFDKKKLEEFNKNCNKRNISIFVSNDVKTLFLLKSNNFYISAHNKKCFKHLKKINHNIQIIGSAHNVSEINEKKKQGCDLIVLSRIFETSYKYKKGHLGTTKFNLLTQHFRSKYIALGGINEKNIRSMKVLNINGCAMLKDKKKAGKYIPALFKK